ncbi:MAG TPA: ComEC/Rec2 family competence protein, partial [bacterium]|nr:ComEC/Rec2 family competence protein [bacterium]
VVMDVGQGDAILIRSPNKKYYLIDAGANSQNILAYLNRLGVKEIEIFFITHPHHDHIDKALDILKNFRVKKFYDSGYPHTSSTYKKILYEIKAQNISYNLAVAGNTINIDNNLKIEILHPDKPNYKNINDNSIVCKFIYKNTSILLTGDAEHTANEVMIKTFGKKIKSDILKTGHHGSRTATDQFFLDYVKPNIAVISCGVSNRYKHPHKEVLELLEKNHIKLYCTDLDGFVILESDGSKWNVTVDKTSIYDIVEEPLKNLKPKYSINFENYEALIKSKKWKKFGDESQFDNSDNALVISANAGEQIYSNNLTCPALVTLPPNEDKWVSVIKMIGSASRNTDGAIALINNSVNWLTFSSANEGKTISINYTKNGKITSDYFKLKFAPLFFAIERYGNRLNFAVSEDNKNWTILKRYDIIDIGIDINKSKLCLTSNAWRKEPATSWFFEYEEY